MPLMPLCFVLAGVAKATSIDLSRHMPLKSVRAVLSCLERHRGVRSLES
jgi:hypothetical protein